MKHANNSRGLTRERFGLALAIAAVACLSSVIVQWSTHFPEEDAVLEQTLFGDLVDETTRTTSERLPLRQTAVLPDLQPLPEQTATKTSGVAFSGVETIDDSIGRPAVIIPTVRFTQPADAEPSSIQPVSYVPSEQSNSGQLSGTIEDSPSHDADPLTAKPGNVVQLGTITFEE